MLLMESSFQDFIKKTEKKKIICYGAGMLPLYLEDLFKKYHIVERIICFLDGNKEKEGQSIVLGSKSIPVRYRNALDRFSAKDSVLLITAEKYPEIIRSLNCMESFLSWDCYVWSFLNLSCFKDSLRKRIPGFRGNTEGVFRRLRQFENKIPKTIHYTWFGGNKKTVLAEKCIESWRKNCPGFQLREWNDDNYDIQKNTYMKQAYEKGKWAYVSDFARLDVLHRFGGIYLDTDVELYKPIDDLCIGEGFICAGEWPAPNSGAGLGCMPGNQLIRDMMSVREEKPFLDGKGNADRRTNSNYEMEVLLKYGFSMDFSFQCKRGFFFYPPDIIAPQSITADSSYITEWTFGKHYCNNSWRNLG